METDGAHVPLFPFPVQPAVSIESALRKLDAGRIDGFLFAMRETDQVLKRLGFKSIQRLPYRKFEAHAIFQDTPRGRQQDALFSQRLKVAKQTGSWQRIMGDLADQQFVAVP
jgi:polar amino acid transport system substrate-binding protein